MVFPDYKNSIVNLMSSILSGFGERYSRLYPPLKSLDKLRNAQNIVLLVVDGLGSVFLEKNAKKNGILTANKVCDITSVGLPTTTAAISTFLTGNAPQQHGLVSWYMNIPELHRIVVVLKSETRIKEKIKIDFKELFKTKMIFEKIKAKSYCIVPKKIIKSPFNKAFTKKAKVIGYKNLNGLFDKIDYAIKKNRKRKYIYAYWPDIDHYCHEYGTNAKITRSHFRWLERKISSFARKLKNTNTTLIVTGDHGLIDSKTIRLDNHKKMINCLRLPVSGESRMSFCHVKKGREKEFERYVNLKLKRYCILMKSKELIKKHFFGFGKINPGLKERVGDYTLIAKKNYSFKQLLEKEKLKIHKAKHGALSREEMMVPLVVVNSD